MGKLMKVFTIAVAISAVAIPCRAAVVHENQKYVLAGLRAAGIKLEYYDVGAKKEWWCRTNAADRAKALLQDFGVQVLGDEQRIGEPGKPFIHVGVDAFERRDPNFIGLYGYAITVSLHETVTLDRNTDVTAHAVTWMKSAEGTVAQYQLPDTIEFRITTLVEDFLRDYLEANRYKDMIPELEKRIASPPVGRRLEYDRTIIKEVPSDYK